MNLIKKFLCMTVLLLLAIVLIGCQENTSGDTVELNIANLYFVELDDEYTEWIEEKFGVTFKTRNYSWADWDQQVTSAVNSDNLPDVFHWNLQPSTYPTMARWAQGMMLKEIPSLDNYPNVKRLVESVNGLDKMKIDGKLYALPLVKNPTNLDVEYSEFTYIYRKDWAKRLATENPSKYGHLYKEDDVYTYSEFKELLYAFKENDMAGNNKTIPLADVEWSFPSVLNYYKKAPFNYVLNDTSDSFIWNHTTPEMTSGVNDAKKLAEDGIYWADQYSAKEGSALTKFKSGVVGAYFENITLSNYSTIRKEFKANNPNIDVNEGTALMHLKKDDGKFVYEGAYNWWSVTMFSSDMSDEAMHKLLEILDWLYSEEGTMFATYGFKDRDYTVDENGKVTVLWEKKSNGEYANKKIGARYLRYIMSLNNDILFDDPTLDKKTKEAYVDWKNHVDENIENNNVYIMPLYEDMNWLSATNKNMYASLDKEAQAAMISFIFGKGGWTEFNQTAQSKYSEVLKEINAALNK